MSDWYVGKALQHTGREGYVVLQPVDEEEPQVVAECLWRDDAELLAAAPAMHEALKLYFDWRRAQSRYYGSDNHLDEREADGLRTQFVQAATAAIEQVHGGGSDG